MPEHTLSIYGYDFLVEPDTETLLTCNVCDDSIGSLKWTVASLSEDRGTVEYDSTETSEVLSITFMDASTQFSVQIEDTNTGVTLVDEVLNCKYVRRELRSIQEADLKKYFKAVQIMYSTSQTEGQALYGKNFISASHLTASHDSKDFTYHGNLYFLTSHPAMQIRFETSLLSIDPSVVLNYWDFLLDHKWGTDWTQSPIYSDEMFGSVDTSAADEWRPSGYFHDVKLVYDPDSLEFPNAEHNPYGFLGSGEMTTSLPHLTRSNSFCGFKSVEGQVECTNLVDCFDSFESEHNLREFDVCLEEKVHANLHMMVLPFYTLFLLEIIYFITCLFCNVYFLNIIPLLFSPFFFFNS